MKRHISLHTPLRKFGKPVNSMGPQNRKVDTLQRGRMFGVDVQQKEFLW